MRRIGRSFTGGLLAVVAGLALTAPASAQAPTLADVEITGDPVVGSTLTAVIAGTVDRSSVAYSWCHQGDRPGKCAKGRAVGSGPAYVLVATDVGHSLLVKATATIDTFVLEVTSPPSAPVTAPSPPPEPAPDPAPEPAPDPTPTPDATAPAPTFASVGEPPLRPTSLEAQRQRSTQRCHCSS